jgi:glutathione peroxidase
MTTAFDFAAPRLNGADEKLSTYKGKVLLIVNTASQCGFTPQYKGLQALHDKYAGKGFEVLGFPCNQFGAQEPGEGDEIASFCEMNYGVNFPMFEKVDVNGSNAHPLWNFLKEQAPGALGIEAVKWNFTKFLVGKDGKVIKRYAPQTEPKEIAKDIEALVG